MPHATQLQFLKRPLVISYRSTSCVQQVQAKISCDTAKKPRSVLVEIINEECQADFEINLDDIKSVLAKDYTQGTQYLWVLFVVTVDAKEAFQFNRREDRDAWEDGLRSLLSSSDIDVLKQDSAGPFLAPINKIGLRRPPGPEVLVSVEMTLGGDPEQNKKELTRYLDVPQSSTKEQDTQRLVREFVRDNEIQPSEKLSLFRYVRTMVERAVTEQETKKLIEEINALHYENLAKGLSSQGSIEEAVAGAKVKLDEIARSIPQRIGKRGTNSTIVGMILQRSTDKMKLVNDMGAKAITKEKEREASRSGRRGFCAC